MRRSPPVGLPALLLAALLTLAGCDGGISGTGIPPVEANGSSESPDGEADGDVGTATDTPTSGADTDGGAAEAPPAGMPPGTGEGDGGADGGATGGTDGSAGGGTDSGGDTSAGANSGTEGGGGTSGETVPQSPGDLDASPRPMENALSVRTGPPSVRLVNTSVETIDLISGSEQRVLVRQLGPAEQASGTVEVPGPAADAGTAEALQAPLRIQSSTSGDPYAIFDPLALVDGSITTLLVRPRSGRVPAVLALETVGTTADPTLALVRIASGVITGDSGGGAADDAGDAFEPLLIGEDGERSLGRISSTDPATAYASVAPGEYRLRDAGGRFEFAGVVLQAGDVVTFVLAGTPGGADSLRLLSLPDSQTRR